MSGFLTDARQRARTRPSASLISTAKNFSSTAAVSKQQRDCYSECAIAQVEAALTQVMSRLETLCRQQDCEQVVSQLLKQFDILTGLSAWSDPKTFH